MATTGSSQRLDGRERRIVKQANRTEMDAAGPEMLLRRKLREGV